MKPSPVASSSKLSGSGVTKPVTGEVCGGTTGSTGSTGISSATSGGTSGGSRTVVVSMGGMEVTTGGAAKLSGGKTISSSTGLVGMEQANSTFWIASFRVMTYLGRWRFGLGFQLGWAARQAAHASAVCLLTRLRTGVV